MTCFDLKAKMGELSLGVDFIPTGERTDDGRPTDMLVRHIDLGQGRVARAGFVTDWGSIPQIIDRAGLDTRRGSMAYLRHDFNYRFTARIRLIADIELYFDQRAEGVNFIERTLVFWGVRIGGGGPYRRYVKAWRAGR